MKALFHALVFCFVGLHIGSVAQTPVWTQFPNTPPPPTGARNDDIYFFDQLNGWSARGTDGVYRTTNGGQSWTKAFTNGVTTPGLTAHFRAIGFASNLRGWTGNLGPGSYDGAVNNTNLLYETFDGGVTWSVVPGLINPPGKTNGFCAIHVLDSQHIYGAGRVRGPAVFYKTENGGSSWFMTNLTDIGVMGGLMDVYFKDPTNGFIVGMNTNLFTSPPYYGSIARTTNGGISWQVLVTTPVANSYFWKMSWPSSQIGYASLQQNGAYNTVVFYKTTDGGNTWVSNGIPLASIGAASFGLQGIGFVSTNEGWMGGSSVLNPPYSLIHTTDGGLTWTPEGYNNTRSINRIRFASPTLGYMSGQALHVYHIPLGVTVSPTNQATFISSNVTFTTTSQGTPPLVFQWRFNGANILNATSSSYSITNIQATNAGNYDVVLGDFSGSSTSAIAPLTVAGIPIPPSIVTQPLDQVVNKGSNATFAVVASGTAPLKYQWRFNESNLIAATNATYTRTNAQSADVGNYTVVVTNIAGSVTSSIAALTLGFVEDFDDYTSPVTVTNIGTTNGYKIFFNGSTGGLDFKAIFGFDYSTVIYPTNIVSAPHTTGGTTKGLYLTVNKDATGAFTAVNLCPAGQTFSNNYSLKFDLWLNWASSTFSTEHALFGINLSGNVTNRIGLNTSDGLFFAVSADGGASSSSGSRDFSVFHGGGAGAAPALMTSSSLFGPTPPLGAQFDNANTGIANLFPAKTFSGWGTTPAGSAGLGWVSCEVRQVNNLITWILNGTAIAQYTNTYGYTNGTILIGYNDNFTSIGDSDSFAVFDNIRVEPFLVTSPTLNVEQPSGGSFNFNFASQAYESYTVQYCTNLAAPTWLAYTNLVGNGSDLNLSVPIGTSRYFRVSRP